MPTEKVRGPEKSTDILSPSETLPAHETGTLTFPETIAPEAPAARPSPPPPAPMPSAPSAAPTNNPVVREVENVMAEGLEETYQRLDPATQWEFKQAGEATATAISSLLAKTKVHVRKIIKLLTGWLKMLPGVSRLFIEQEAKIKADKLLALRRSLRRDDE